MFTGASWHHAAAASGQRPTTHDAHDNAQVLEWGRQRAAAHVTLEVRRNSAGGPGWLAVAQIRGRWQGAGGPRR
ncbi:hypothetical protein [Paraburkholderia rhizosphaerae]|uniref:Uncharacterized protein n=1 Tax=Paraburkholderia rhizosphaerae TaxID=480658 RepID=A0A4R8LDS6_9BURK|nr:hypothetical protein [Paraburkholderia rhizosphaerae]TDY40438.1 hypothetical protein BX592_12582 [Paraburkholderia rhizosphaerae]